MTEQKKSTRADDTSAKFVSGMKWKPLWLRFDFWLSLVSAIMGTTALILSLLRYFL